MIYLPISMLIAMHISNHFVVVCNIRIVVRIYKLNDLKFEVLPEDFVRKLEKPRLIPVGRSRVNYVF